MKKVIVLLMIMAVVVTSFSGCAKKEAPVNEVVNTPTSKQSSETIDVEAKTEEINVEDITGEVMLYSSMKEEQLALLKTGFMKKYPKINMDYYSAGTGSVMTKIATEEQSGKIFADIIWVGDPTHYVGFKERGILLPYESPEAEFIPDAFKDEDNMFIGARIVTLGFVYNTELVSEADVPKKWEDLLDSRFKDEIVMTDPTFSGTTLTCVAGLTDNTSYGWDYLKGLKENEIKLEKGSSAVITMVGAGEYQVGIGADYIARSLKNQGGTVEFVTPEKDIPLVVSPIAIIKDTENEAATKLFYDYILSEEGQSLLTESFTTPVRTGIVLENATPVDILAANAMEVDANKVIEQKEKMINDFDLLFKAE